MENLKVQPFSQKVVAVAVAVAVGWLTRCGRLRGSNNNAWTGEILVFWISDRNLWEVVAHGGSTVCILVNPIVNQKANIQPK